MAETSQVGLPGQGTARYEAVSWVQVLTVELSKRHAMLKLREILVQWMAQSHPARMMAVPPTASAV